MNKLSTIKERILQIAKYKNISYEIFCPAIGMSYANFRGNAKKTPINSDAIATLLTKYDNINPIWLLLGEGEMFLNHHSNEDNINKETTDNFMTKEVFELIKTQGDTIQSQQRAMDNLQAKIDKLEKKIAHMESAGCADADTLGVAR